jgi:hypothetical protein
MVVAILVLHMRGTGFTCDDDMFTATARFRWEGIWNAAWTMAKGHGRFYHLFVYPIVQLPYLFSGFEIPTFTRMLSTASVFGAFFFTVKSLLGSVAIASFFTLMVAGILTCTHMFNPVHALPLWFNLGMTVLLVAILFFSDGLTKDSVRLRRLSGIFYFFALLYYEIIFVYVVFFPILAFLRHSGFSASFQDRMRWSIRVSLPVFLAAGLWLVCWISFRAAFPADYSGGNLGLGHPNDMLGTVLQFSLSGLNFNAIWNVSWKWNGWALAAAAASGLAMFLLLRQIGNRFSWHLLALFAVIGAFFAIAPNAVFGLTPRYREWVKHDTYYLGSFYASFSLVFLVGAIFLSIQRLARNRLISAITSFVLASIFTVNTYANKLDAEQFFKTHRVNRQAWTIVELSLTKGMAEQLPQETVLVAPLLMNMPMLEPGAYDYWSYYMTQALGYPLQVVSNHNEKSQLPQSQRVRLPSVGSEKKLLGLSVSYSRRYKAGFAALAEIDRNSWRREPSRLKAKKAFFWFTGEKGSLRLEAVSGDGRILSFAIDPILEVQGADNFDLTTLSLRE